MTSVSELQAWINTTLESKWTWICLWAWSIAGILAVGTIGIIGVFTAVLWMWWSLSVEATQLAKATEARHAEAMSELGAMRQEIHQTQQVIVEHREGLFEEQFRKIQEKKRGLEQ